MLVTGSGQIPEVIVIAPGHDVDLLRIVLPLARRAA